eukprot:2193076-Alexandrium_andersonii.AAC.1
MISGHVRAIPGTGCCAGRTALSRASSTRGLHVSSPSSTCHASAFRPNPIHVCSCAQYDHCLLYTSPSPRD